MAAPFRILVPTDFSASSETAFSLAIALASANKPAEIVLLHVIEPSVPGYDEELGVLEPEALQTKMQLLGAGRVSEVEMQTKLVHGDPSSAIVQTARELKSDVILMGSHGRSAMVQFLMGSTAKAVLRRAGCPVLTVRDNSAVATSSD